MSSVLHRVEKERRKTVCRRVSLEFDSLGGKHIGLSHSREKITRHKRTFFVGSSQLASTEKKSKRDYLEVVGPLSWCRLRGVAIISIQATILAILRTFVVASSQFASTENRRKRGGLEFAIPLSRMLG